MPSREKRDRSKSPRITVISTETAASPFTYQMDAAFERLIGVIFEQQLGQQNQSTIQIGSYQDEQRQSTQASNE